MKFSLGWLKEYLDTEASAEEIAEQLTMLGLEVETITDRAAELAPFTVAEVLEATAHPDADKLRVCKVNNGREILNIVCGAANARAGIKVVLASPGATIPANGMVIKLSKIRGVESQGMLCSTEELRLSGSSEGIIELPADAPLGEPFAPVLGLGDPVIEISVTPNRSDCLGIYGIARDLAAAGMGRLKPEGVTNEDFQRVITTGSFECPVRISIATPGCSYFVGRVIRGVKNGESPAWMKQRLESVGQKPISALVDITNYLTLAYGRPAHVYDVAKLTGSAITVRGARPGEKLHALDAKEYALKPAMTAIADDSGVLGLGGILGGASTGCNADTTDIFLEIALFDAANIAATGRALLIESDARHRFERFVSSSTLKHFITATRLIMQLCGGEASKPVVAGSIPLERRKVIFRPVRVKELVGLEMPESAMQNILEKLGFQIDRSTVGGEWKLGVPSWRPDVEGEPDICEEIARIHGYGNIPATPLPLRALTRAVLTPRQRAAGELRRILSQRGLREAVTFSFISSAQAALFLPSPLEGEGGGRGVICLENPISSDLDAMRPSILPSLLAAVARNAARAIPDLALFEAGPIFSGAEPGEQAFSAACLRSGQVAPKHPLAPARPVDALDAKADALAGLMPYLNPDNLRAAREAPHYYHPGRSGALKLGDKMLAWFGEIHPAILKAFGIEHPVVACELFPENAPAPKEKKSFARPKAHFSPYQPVERDFAFLVDLGIPAEALLSAVRKADKTLIESVAIFDIYTGKGVEEGKQSVALSVRLQPKETTLTDAEIEAFCRKVVENVRESVGGALRV